ncbi:hypothetical protein [Bradyrhizobium japonicum]|uniref:hypothetical protein n=1 Tax=Bradyrhizobium japonicum TaxID=375 RepID=UPI00209D876D|nr:hypothetical protein [Bradyrhizobium japonicum]MCP1761985.1 hypothetical protein [Bradyrhizobium japonicum]MCP1793565.1 hypothetical protein [Bradyrhizobium japonicum]MCP1805998.1 hypothetical protein [Bradyrhizobium japonicum]MCP1812401.1 hypothetical protein [Bradyrhizobium japonicum]MCP1873556.1 hypothetical protein [Bradyrhizobium japonicum]
MMSAAFTVGLIAGLVCGGSLGAIIMAIFVMGKDSDFPHPKGEHYDPRERNHQVGDRVAKQPR